MQQSTGSNGDEMATATVDGEQLLVTSMVTIADEDQQQ